MFIQKRKACGPCIVQKVKCDSARPCSQCCVRGLEIMCSDVARKTRHKRARLSDDDQEPEQQTKQPSDLAQSDAKQLGASHLQNLRFPLSDQEPQLLKMPQFLTLRILPNTQNLQNQYNPPSPQTSDNVQMPQSPQFSQISHEPQNQTIPCQQQTSHNVPRPRIPRLSPIDISHNQNQKISQNLQCQQQSSHNVQRPQIPHSSQRPQIPQNLQYPQDLHDSQVPCNLNSHTSQQIQNSHLQNIYQQQVPHQESKLHYPENRNPPQNIRIQQNQNWLHHEQSFSNSHPSNHEYRQILQQNSSAPYHCPRCCQQCQQDIHFQYYKQLERTQSPYSSYTLQILQQERNQQILQRNPHLMRDRDCHETETVN
eukprot:Phypoly_transcript_07122.p1 GENE.Phypoly_transcript_07122~~Phypoly_transcript_07122.p1  ORF type:complete len:368 (+),score=39.29 Phypoly_transcript_07122:41-1144(+)